LAILLKRSDRLSNIKIILNYI